MSQADFSNEVRTLPAIATPRPSSRTAPGFDSGGSSPIPDSDVRHLHGARVRLLGRRPPSVRGPSAERPLELDRPNTTRSSRLAGGVHNLYGWTPPIPGVLTFGQFVQAV
jgi:hypothetical protein